MNNASKPEIIANLTAKDSLNLAAHPYLYSAHTNKLYELQEGRRPPLGIYSISTSRILGRALILSNLVERYFAEVNDSKSHSASSALINEILEKVESCLYAAAEHVDDTHALLKCFESIGDKRINAIQSKAAVYRLNGSRRFISHCVNSIKHNQSRIRMLALDIGHGGNRLSLPAVFFETTVGDAVVPDSKPFKASASPILSLSSLIWEVLIFIGINSINLATYLKEIGVSPLSDESDGSSFFSDAVISTTRLPLYAFDEMHPFSKTKFILSNALDVRERLNSDLYGSLMKPWADTTEMQFGPMTTSFQGDGVTKTFGLPTPTKVNLHRWD